MTVTVTGATGFIASHLVQQLLERGHHVRGTVRNLQRREATAHLRALPGAERLELVEADLRDPGGFDVAVRGATCVMHTASPYMLTVKDPQRDLVEPAVAGTRHVLRACAAEPGITRVVVTSSVAAVTDAPDPSRAVTEADWNTSSTLTRNPYFLSKTLAERAAWAFMDHASPAFDLVVVNPFFVIGPSLSPALNESNKVLVDMLTGRFPAIVDLTWGFVDVRDVAHAHVRAMEVPGAAGRYLCVAEALTVRQLVACMRETGYGTYRLPRLGLDTPVGTQIARLVSLFQPSGQGSYLRTHLGRGFRFDNSKIRRELGMQFRDVRASILETLEDLKRWGHLPPP